MEVRDVLNTMQETAEAMKSLGEKIVEAAGKFASPQVVGGPVWDDNPWIPFAAIYLLTSRETRSALYDSTKEYLKSILRQGGINVEKALDTSDLATVLPSGVLSFVEREIENVAVGRKIFRNVKVQEKTGRIPYSSAVTATWLTEGQAPASEAEPTIAGEAWTVNTLGAGLTITYEALNDVAFVANLIRELFTQALAEAEDKAFLTGTGTGEPKGIYTYVSADAIDGTNKGLDVLFEAWAALKGHYRADAVWFMNENTLANLLKQKNSESVYYLAPNIAEGPTAGRLFGRPLYTNTNLADNVILVGSPSRYFVLDKVSQTGAPERGIVLTSEGKTLTATRSVYMLAYERLDGRLIYDSSNLKTWVAITNFLQTV